MFKSIYFPYTKPKAAGSMLQHALENRCHVYLEAATGFGKSALLHAMLKEDTLFLDGEFLEEKDLQPFLLPDRSEKILVIDNLHAIRLFEIRKQIRNLLHQHKIQILLAGRGHRPEWLFPEFVMDLFMVIEEADFCLQESQIKTLFYQNGLQTSAEQFAFLVKILRGYPLLVRLFLKRILEEKEVSFETAGRKCQEDLWHFIYTQAYCGWPQEVRSGLVKLCYLPNFTISMASILLGNTAEEILQMAMESGSFLEYFDHRYSWRKGMQNFLLSIASRSMSSEDKKEVLVLTAKAFEEDQNWAKALEFYEQAQKKEEIYRILKANARKNPGSGYFYEMKRWYLQLTIEEAGQDPEMMAALSMLHSILMDPLESEIWYERLCEFMQHARKEKKKEAQSWRLYLDIGLPHRGSRDIRKIFFHLKDLPYAKYAALPEFSVTSNQPSIMNGGKDFSMWSKEDTLLARTIGKPVTIAMGSFGKGLVSLALAESAFEKGADFDAVKKLVVKGEMEAATVNNKQMLFVASAIKARIALFENRGARALQILENFKKELGVENKKTAENFQALSIRIRLMVHPDHRFESLPDSEEENLPFNTLDRYLILARIRVFMAAGKKEQALEWIEKMESYASSFERRMIWMEARLLKAILYRSMDRKEWKELILQVLVQASSFHFTRLVSREGAAVFSLLKEIRAMKSQIQKHGFKSFSEAEISSPEWIKEQPDKKLWQERKLKPEQKEEFWSYFEEVFEETEKMASWYPDYLQSSRISLPSFSAQALEILELQAKGFSISEIARQVGLNVNTVKYHNKMTYRKLNVKNKTQAIVKARELHLLKD